jgi:hypothetical protein
MDKGQNAVSQMPQSDKPFSPEMLQMIAKMKPDQIVADTKKAIAEMEQEAPELKDTVDLDAIDMMGVSIKFLQLAAKEFPPGKLQEIYALEMPRLLDADPKEVEDVAKEIIAMAKTQPAYDQEMQKREQELKSLGGDAELEKRGWPVRTDHALRCDVQRKIEILKNPGKYPPPNPPPQTAQPNDQAYSQLGGDNALSDLIDKGFTKCQLTAPLGTKLTELTYYETYKTNGGDAIWQEMVNVKDIGCKKGIDLMDRATMAGYYSEFKQLGGENELNRLSANPDDRIKPWKNRAYEKLRALKDYKCLEKDGADFDRLGGLKKLETAQKDFEGFDTGTFVGKLDVLRKLDDLESRGGINRFRALLRIYKAQSTTLWENLDSTGKKVRTAFAPYLTRRGGIEGLVDLTGILDVVTRAA